MMSAKLAAEHGALSYLQAKVPASLKEQAAKMSGELGKWYFIRKAQEAAPADRRFLIEYRHCSFCYVQLSSKGWERHECTEAQFAFWICRMARQLDPKIPKTDRILAVEAHYKQLRDSQIPREAWPPVLEHALRQAGLLIRKRPLFVWDPEPIVTGQTGPVYTVAERSVSAATNPPPNLRHFSK